MQVSLLPTTALQPDQALVSTYLPGCACDKLEARGAGVLCHWNECLVCTGGRRPGGHGNGRGSKVFAVEGASPHSLLSGPRLSRQSSLTEPWSSGSSWEARSLLKHMSSLGGSRLSRVSEPEASCYAS